VKKSRLQRKKVVCNELPRACSKKMQYAISRKEAAICSQEIAIRGQEPAEGSRIVTD
jgi:hypothetical protein